MARTLRSQGMAWDPDVMEHRQVKKSKHLDLAREQGRVRDRVETPVSPQMSRT